MENMTSQLQPESAIQRSLPCSTCCVPPAESISLRHVELMLLIYGRMIRGSDRIAAATRCVPGRRGQEDWTRVKPHRLLATNQCTTDAPQVPLDRRTGGWWPLFCTFGGKKKCTIPYCNTITFYDVNFHNIGTKQRPPSTGGSSASSAVLRQR